MAEAKVYDFDFITKSLGLGLIPILDNTVAVNPGAITDMKESDKGGFTIFVHGGNSYHLNDEQMKRLELTLKVRIQQGKAEYEETVEFQMRAQANVRDRIQRNVQPTGGMIVGDGRPMRRPR